MMFIPDHNRLNKTSKSGASAPSKSDAKQKVGSEFGIASNMLESVEFTPQQLDLLLQVTRFFA